MKQHLRIAVAQMRPRPGDVRHNLAQILRYIEEARGKRADLVVFPELSTSGYLLGDRWENDTFIGEIEEANRTIARASIGIAVVWGSVVTGLTKIGEDGRLRKYNAALVAQNGSFVPNNSLMGFLPKTNLPKYRIFDDARHFYPAGLLAAEMRITLEELLQPFVIKVGGRPVRLGVTVCEDLWDDEYNTKPSQIYGKRGVDLLVDISQSPWTAEKWHAREAMLRRRYIDAATPILYVNSVGLQNNVKNLVWFDGDSCYLNEEGHITWRAPRNCEGLHVFRADQAQDPVSAHRKEGIAEIYEALMAAMREFFAPWPKVVIGVSGGIDSAVSLALLCIALGSDRVIAVNMPTRFNSHTTRDLAFALCRNFGVEYRIVDIDSIFSHLYDVFVHAGFDPSPSLVQENMQARIRGADILAGIASMVGGVFVANGNKTEVALNYLTLYGDGAGAAAFLADLWKGQIYELADYINEHSARKIPTGILQIKPSAELSAEQNVDEGKGDPIYYPYHDNLLRAFTEWRWDPLTVLKLWTERKLETTLRCHPGTLEKHFPTRQAFVENLEWAWRQYNIDWKRAQLPPVFLASRRAFGYDRRDTIAEGYFTEEYQRLKEKYLHTAA